MVAVSAAAILKSYISPNVTFPRALLDRAALALLLHPLCLRGPARARRLALGLYHMGSGNHLRQPAARVGAVRLLRSETPRGDDELAAAGDAAAGDLLQPLVGVGMKAEPEQVDAKLDRGRDLVDVLPAGAGRGEEGLAERVLRDRQFRSNPSPDGLSRNRQAASRRNSREAAR